MKFRTVVLQSGKTATGIQIPEKAVVALGSGKRPAVRVSLNGYTYRSTVAVMGGKYMVGVSAEVRAAAGVAGGDEVDVTLSLDTAPRDVPVPAELRQALDREPLVKEAFDRLSNSKKQRFTLPIEKAKTEATRKRNTDKAMEELRGRRRN